MREKDGLTLLELMVVLAIIVIASSFVIPQVGEWLAHFRLRQSARQIASDLRFAQAQAISTAKETMVQFFPESDEYVIVWDNNNKTTKVLKGVDIVSADFGRRQYVHFSPQGFPKTLGGSVELKNDRLGRGIKILMSAAGRIRFEEIK